MQKIEKHFVIQIRNKERKKDEMNERQEIKSNGSHSSYSDVKLSTDKIVNPQ